MRDLSAGAARPDGTLTLRVGGVDGGVGFGAIDLTGKT